MLNNDASIKTGPVTPPLTTIKPFSEDTRKLQQDLNKAIAAGHIPGPALLEDGREGPRTRAKLEQLQTYQQTQAKPAAPATPAAPVAPPADQVVTRDPTVGEYVEGRIKTVGEEFKSDAQVAAITAVAAPVVAVIEARHMNQARERISKLPMDPEGKWKDAAAKIVDEEQGKAKQEILALPHQVVQGVADGAQAVVDGAQAAGEWAGNQVDAAGQAAQQVWGEVRNHSGKAWEYAKEAVPRAFKAVGEDAAVAAIALNPLGAIPSAIIMNNHMAAAYDRIMKLPMDPDGKWKDTAAKIVDEEQGKAKHEILALPGKAYQGVVDTASGVYHAASAAVVATGKAIADTADAGYQLAKEGVTQTRHGVGGLFGSLGNAIQRFGKWLAGE